MSEKHRRRRTIVAVIWAILAPCVASGVWAALLDHVDFPILFSNIGGWLPFETSIGIGALFVFFLPIKARVRTIVTLLYVPAMCFLLLAFQLLVFLALYHPDVD